MNQLIPGDKIDYVLMGPDKCHEVIKDNLLAFYRVGMALREIRDGKYYKNEWGFETFEDYCKDIWEFSRARAYQLVDSTYVMDVLSTKVDIVPNKETHVRPLTALLPDHYEEAWNRVLKDAPEKITGKHVKEIADTFKIEHGYEVSKSVEIKFNKDNSESEELSQLKSWWQDTKEEDRELFRKWIDEAKEE